MKKISFLFFLFICLFSFNLNVNASTVLTENSTLNFTSDEVKILNDFIKNDTTINSYIQEYISQYNYYYYYLRDVSDLSNFSLRIYFFDTIPVLKVYSGSWIYIDCPTIVLNFNIRNLTTDYSFVTEFSSCDFAMITSHTLVYNNSFSYLKYFDSNFDLYFYSSFNNYPVIFSYLGNDYSLNNTDIFPTMISYYNLQEEDNTQIEEKLILFNFIDFCMNRIRFLLDYMLNSYIFMFLFCMIIIYLIIIIIKKFFMR